MSMTRSTRDQSCLMTSSRHATHLATTVVAVLKQSNALYDTNALNRHHGLLHTANLYSGWQTLLV